MDCPVDRDESMGRQPGGNLQFLVAVLNDYVGYILNQPNAALKNFKVQTLDIYRKHEDFCGPAEREQCIQREYREHFDPAGTWHTLGVKAAEHRPQVVIERQEAGRLCHPDIDECVTAANDPVKASKGWVRLDGDTAPTGAVQGVGV